MAAAVAGFFFPAARHPTHLKEPQTPLKGGHMRGLKVLLGSTALLVGLTLAPAAQSQVYVNIGAQPVCSYGYYGYAPYQCAPMGYYGPGYFYTGIFLGMGPWGGWGYSHGWGGHRFSGEGGGSYRGGPGNVNFRASGGGAVRGGNVSHASAAVSNGGGARPSAGHAAVASHSNGGGQAHAAPQARGGGGQSRGSGGGGGQAHGGGGGGSHGGGGGRK